MTSALLDPILHTLVALGLLAAYCVLWALGHQDTTLLGILAGQLGALGVSQVAQKASDAAGSSTVDNPTPGTGTNG